MFNSLLLSILVSLFTLSNTQPATLITAEDGTQVYESFYTHQSNQETLILTEISSHGYHFTNPDTKTGAFIPLSEASNYHVNNLKVNNIVTMVFDTEGNIVKVNGKEINQK